MGLDSVSPSAILWLLICSFVGLMSFVSQVVQLVDPTSHQVMFICWLLFCHSSGGPVLVSLGDAGRASWAFPGGLLCCDWLCFRQSDFCMSIFPIFCPNTL